MIIETERVRLRPFKKEDLDIVHTWRNDPELRFLAMMHPYPVTREQDLAWFEHLLIDTSNKTISFACETRQDCLLFGYFQLRDINQIQRHAFLGIVIGENSYRGKGYGREICSLGIMYGSNYLGLHKISLDVLADNKNAIALYIKLGFKEEGVFKFHFYFDNKYHDVVRMALLI